MNKLRYIVLLIVVGIGLSACQQEEVPVYMDEDRVNFIGHGEYDEDDPDYLYAEKNFLSVWGNTDTLILEVKIQGRPSALDRSVFFTVRDSTAPGVEMKFGECVVPANSTRGKCKVAITRPTGEKELISFIGIDYERSDFARGTYERQQFMVKMYDKISYELLGIEDWFWDGYLLNTDLGAWSFTKAKFICGILGITDLSAWYFDPAHWITDWETATATCFDKEVLLKALDDYKADTANPPLYDETLLPEEVWISFD